jgi:hypothetical protein
MVALRSIPFPVFAAAVGVIQRGKLVRRRAVFFGMTNLIVQVRTGHRIGNAVDVDVGG